MALLEWRWCWPRLSEPSSAMICTSARGQSLWFCCLAGGYSGQALTEHVALAVLTTPLAGNVRLHAEIYEGEVLDREHVGLNASH